MTLPRSAIMRRDAKCVLCSDRRLGDREQQWLRWVWIGGYGVSGGLFIAAGASKQTAVVIPAGAILIATVIYHLWSHGDSVQMRKR